MLCCSVSVTAPCIADLPAGNPFALPKPSSTNSHPFEDCLVVTRSGLDCLFLLNGSGRLIWEGLEAGATASELAGKLSRGTGTPLESAREQVRAAVREWEQQGLLGPAKPKPLSGPVLEGTGSLPEPTATSHVTGTSRGAQSTLWFRFLGKVVRISCLDPSLASAIRIRYANLASTPHENIDVDLSTQRQEPFHVLLLEGREVARSSTDYGLTYCLLRTLVNCVHGQPDLTAWLHGGLVSKDEVSIGIVGRERSGKSTLTAALLHAGYECNGDDRIFLTDNDLLPLATPNSIGVKEGSWSVLRPRFPEISSLPILKNGGQKIRFLSVTPPQRFVYPSIRHLIFPRYESGSETRLRPLSSVEALVRTIEAYSWVDPSPARVGLFLKWIRSVPCHELPFSSLDQAVDLIRSSCHP